MKRKITIYVIAGSIILVGFLIWNTRSTTVPKLDIPKTGIQINITHLEIKIPSQKMKKLRQIETVPIYKYVLPDRNQLATLAKSLGCNISPASYGETQSVKSTNEKGETLYFTYEPANGCWNWLNQTLQENATGENLPSDQTCQELATKKLKTLGIYQGQSYTLHIEPETGINEQGEVMTVAKTLFFYPEIDGQTIEGVSRMIVSLGNNGEIYEISKYCKDFVKAGDREVINVDIALEKAKCGDASFTLDESVEHARLTDAALTYWEDSSDIHTQSYLQPVWVFQGEIPAGSAENAQFEGIVPALK